MALDKLLEQEAQSEIERIRAEARTCRCHSQRRPRPRQSLLDSRSRALQNQRQAGLVRARSAAELERSASRLKVGESGLTQVYSLVEGHLQEVVQAPDTVRSCLA